MGESILCRGVTVVVTKAKVKPPGEAPKEEGLTIPKKENINVMEEALM